MSLVQFHILLISVSILFGTGFGFWEMAHYSNTHTPLDLWTGVASFAAAGGLGVYLWGFIRRLNKR